MSFLAIIGAFSIGLIVGIDFAKWQIKRWITVDQPSRHLQRR